MSVGHSKSDRREFLLKVSSAAAAAGLGLSHTAEAAAPAPAASPFPTIQLGPHRISRMVVGWNPIGGHSHTTIDMALAMREWFTVEHIVDLLENCLRNGITTWQNDHTPEATAALRTLREKGKDIQNFCLHAERRTDAPIKQVIEDLKPFALVHHGGVTDSEFLAGKRQTVRDFVKKVKDAGLLAGVSSHSPDNIKRVMDEGWENDFFMCCFYYVSRPKAEMQKQLGKVPVHEPFFESDPADMTAVMRQATKPCLGFKILAAGRLCWKKPQTEQAFKYAFQNIKPIDGVIVGMFPRYTDQVSENAGYARKYGAVGG